MNVEGNRGEVARRVMHGLTSGTRGESSIEPSAASALFTLFIRFCRFLTESAKLFISKLYHGETYSKLNYFSQTYSSNWDAHVEC